MIVTNKLKHSIIAFYLYCPIDYRMSYNQEIAPWQTFNEDEPILNSLRKVSKSHRRSMILPPSVPLHPSGSPRMQLASPEIDHQTES